MKLQAFIEWKSHIKAKIRNNAELSDVEKKCANLTGLYIFTGGIQEIPELGIAVAGKFYKFL